MKFRTLAFCFLILFGTCLATRTVVRADGIAVTISPLNAELDVKAGTQTTGVISVLNELPPDHSVLVPNAPDDVLNAHLKAYTMDWALDDDGNMSFPSAGAASDSCSSWIQLNPATVSVPPGQSVSVRYTITAPSSANGTYHTMIMFQQIPDTSAGHGRVSGVTGRIGCAIYVNVGDAAKRGRITDFKVDAHSADLTVQNTGTTILRIKGTITIADKDGLEYQSVPIPGALILPGPTGSRHIAIRLPATLKPGMSTATAIVDYGSEVLLGAKCSASSE